MSYAQITDRELALARRAAATALTTDLAAAKRAATKYVKLPESSAKHLVEDRKLPSCIYQHGLKFRVQFQRSGKIIGRGTFDNLADALQAKADFLAAEKSSRL